MSDASQPVPNDDGRCRCLLDPESVPDGFMVLGFGTLDIGGRIAYDPSCPLHGAAVRAMSKNPLTSFSLG